MTISKISTRFKDVLDKHATGVYAGDVALQASLLLYVAYLYYVEQNT